MDPLSPLSMEARDRLSALKDAFDQAAAHLLGYPTNQNFDFSELLPFLQYSANNVGDPFHDSNYRVNTHEIEREVVARFAAMMRLDANDAWGYVTTGGTEGNMYGLYMSRELYPQGCGLFFPGYALQHPQNPTRAEYAQHHDSKARTTAK